VEPCTSSADAIGEHVADARKDAARRIVRRRPYLMDDQTLGAQAHEIGERPAGVDAKTR
jgi:hypothetical protein